MSDDIYHRNGIDCYAYRGPVTEIWHKKGQSADAAGYDAMTPEAQKAWRRKNSGHDFIVDKVPLLAAFTGPEYEHLEDKFPQSEWFALARRDDGHMFAPVTATYQTVQTETIDDLFDWYIAQDERFQWDGAGVLGDGALIWNTARFTDDVTVAGDKIILRLLGSTSYDATMASRVEATTTRVVCRNTLRAAWASDKAVIKVSHRSKFNVERVRKELEQIVASFEEFKRMGDAMATVSLSRQETAEFLRNLLDIPLEAKRDDISTKMQNIVSELETAINATMRERATNDPDAWCLLNGVTRYVDHDRSVRTDRGRRDEISARFEAATFGAGDAMKGKAIQLLAPIVKARAYA